MVEDVVEKRKRMAVVEDVVGKRKRMAVVGIV